VWCGLYPRGDIRRQPDRLDSLMAASLIDLLGTIQQRLWRVRTIAPTAVALPSTSKSSSQANISEAVRPNPIRAAPPAGRTLIQGQEPVPLHQDFLTVLVCGRELASDPRFQQFDKVIFHDEIARTIEAYPEPELPAAL
jgi:hypothetical protein